MPKNLFGRLLNRNDMLEHQAKYREKSVQSADPENPAHRETPRSSAPVLKYMVSYLPPLMTHTSSERPFLADLEKKIHIPLPQGNEILAHQTKSSENCWKSAKAHRVGI